MLTLIFLIRETIDGMVARRFGRIGKVACDLSAARRLDRTAALKRRRPDT